MFSLLPQLTEDVDRNKVRICKRERDLKNIVFIVVSLFSFSVLAQTESQLAIPTEGIALKKNQAYSEALFFPAAGMPLVTLTPEYRSFQQNSIENTQHSSWEYSEKRLNLSYDVALAHSFWALSFAAYMGQASLTQTRSRNVSSYDFSGVGDLKAEVKRLIVRDEYSLKLYAGAAVFYSPGDHEIATLNHQGNMYSGGNSLLPFFALEFPTTYGSAGAKISYKIYGDSNSVDKNNAGDEVEKITTFGQRTLSLGGFTELNKPTYAVGLLGQLNFIGASTARDNEGGRRSNAGQSVFGATVYGKIKMSRQIDIVPALTYDELLNKNINHVNYSKSNDLSLALGVGITL